MQLTFKYGEYSCVKFMLKFAVGSGGSDQVSVYLFITRQPLGVEVRHSSSSTQRHSVVALDKIKAEATERWLPL